MIEIVFSDSAGGTLKHAQHYGKGTYNDEGHPAFIYYGVKAGGGEKTSQEEINAYLKSYHEKERRAWESAVPLEGRSSDVYAIALGLSIGDIAGDEFSAERLQHIPDIVPPRPGFDMDAYLQQKHQRFRDMMDHAMERLAAGESVRIWYSHSAGEYCGLLWFCWKMRTAGVPLDHVYTVKLPDWYYDESEETVFTYSGWGGVETARIGHMAKSTQLLPKQFVLKCAADWEALRRENSPLRAVVSGQLISVPEDFYDHLLRKEMERLATEKEVFGVGQLIGPVMNYQIGIWDSWLACRVRKMIDDGILKVIEESDDGRFYGCKVKMV